MNRIVLLRHGRTRHNAESRLQGAVDLALDPAGREQMARAGEYLRERFDVRRVITSASKRATESATAAGLDDLGPGV
ncbi:MAG: phosphoglycerate mutase family protein, partial [Acidimicrobiales bacterium]